MQELALGVEVHDQVYIGLEMGKNPDADTYLIDVWRGRQRNDNWLTHMKPPPRDMARSDTSWQEAGLECYTSPEDIRGVVVSPKRDFNITFDHANEAAQQMALWRAEGTRRTRAMLQTYVAQHFIVPEVLEATA